MTLNTYADGDVLLASQLNGDFALASAKHKSATTLNTQTGTTEAVMAEILIPAGSFDGGALVLASGLATGSGGIPTHYARLYTGTDSDYTNNTLRHTVTVQHNSFANTWTMQYIVSSEEDWANEDVYFTLVGDNTNATWSTTPKNFNVIGLGSAL